MLGARGFSLASSVGPPVLLPGALDASKHLLPTLSVQVPLLFLIQRVGMFKGSPGFFPPLHQAPRAGSQGSRPAACGQRDNPAIARSPETPPCHGRIQPRLGAGSALEPHPAEAGSMWEVSGSAGMLEGRDAEVAAWQQPGVKQRAEGSGEAQGLCWGQIPNATPPTCANPCKILP